MPTSKQATVNGQPIEDLKFEFEAVNDEEAIVRSMLIIAALTGETPEILDD